MLIFFAIETAFAQGFVEREFTEVRGDFDGDGREDLARGFPDADIGAGRVDIHWGALGAKPTLPTILSPRLDPGTILVPGRFGAALAVGDFNGDDVDDLAIGAPGYDDGGNTDAGRVIVLFGCTSTCGNVDPEGRGLPTADAALNIYTGQRKSMTGVPGHPDDAVWYGYALASADFDADGFDDLAIGAPGKHQGAGRVYIRPGKSSGLGSSVAVLSQSQIQLSESGDRFGTSLLAVNLDGQGGLDLLVGAPGEDYGSDVNAGQVDSFFTGPAGRGLDNSDGTFYRNQNSVTGGSRTEDRLGTKLTPSFWGVLAHLKQATDCDDSPGRVLLSAGTTLNPLPIFGIDPLSCAWKVCSGNGSVGDGGLRVLGLQYVVATVNSDPRVPSPTWSGIHPITRRSISGLRGYFEAMTDLLNQQMISNTTESICRGFDCVRFKTARIIDSVDPVLCPGLTELADPLGQPDPWKYTDNCSHEDFNSEPAPRCPTINGVDTSSFSDFANRAVQECIDNGGLDDNKLAFLVYDSCRRDASRNVTCSGSGARNGRGRSGLRSATDNRSGGFPNPYAFVDYERALQERDNTTFAQAAEDHEAGHALGLHHQTFCTSASGPDVPLMFTFGEPDTCPPEAPGRNRTLGVSDELIEHAYTADLGEWNEVSRMVTVARRHFDEVFCP